MATVQIDKDDIFYAVQWLKVKLEEPDWLTDDFDKVLAARKELNKLKNTNKPDKLQEFCDNWLSEEQHAQLDKSLCIDRKRREHKPKDKPVSVNMTERAFMILSRLAQQESCTVSEVIEKYMFEHVNCGDH
ncbi:MAG: hypothetical protein OQK73_00670 [Gammaproteobacteria bacterium]|nr:hypothetical protein [Gammaproteobacteria bacterium]